MGLTASQNCLGCYAPCASSPQRDPRLYYIWETSSMGESSVSQLCHDPHLLHINQRCCTLQLCHSCHDGECFLSCKALDTTEHLLIWSAQLKILQVAAKLHNCVLTLTSDFSTEATQGKQIDFGGILVNSWLSIVPPKSNFQNPLVAVSLQSPPFLVPTSLLLKFMSAMLLRWWQNYLF